MKHFIECTDFSEEEFINLFELARRLKKDASYQPLLNKHVGLIFEKPSLRTRVSFEVGVKQLGGHPIHIKGDEISLGKREPVEDVARVLSRLVDMVMIRTFSHDLIKEFSKYATIPVINGLTDYSHPCQAVSDFLTIMNHFGSLKNQKIVYLGDGNNVCRSLVKLSKILGVDCVVSTPKNHLLDEAQYTYIEDPKEAVKDATVLYTDTWISMGEEESGKGTDDFKAYQINSDLVSRASSKAIVLHCLPAHKGDEITYDVFEMNQRHIFDQAENRLHAQKAIMAYLMAQK
jgi:ornithine carbamoyltransferase